ncbi:MAG: hypothetical protein H6707_18755 [Deltaproteobacteria bacterium]|nr:hypothetical protein [Deltaproteobacteria bacterium]
MMRNLWVVSFLLLAACSDSISEQELARIIDESRSCQAGDVCVVAGSSQCHCPSPINVKFQARVEQAVKDLDCRGSAVKCSPLSNPRCEQGKCVADGPLAGSLAPGQPLR